MLERLKASLENAPAVKMRDYDYFIFPIADGIPSVSPELLREVIDALESKIDGDYDKIVAAEAMGIHLAAGLSLKTGKPYSIIRKRRYGLAGEVEFDRMTGYSDGKMYINGLSKGDRVVIVDDLISTGGTLAAILRALGGMGVKVADIVIVIDKGNGRKRVEEEFGIRIKTLVSIEAGGGRVRLRRD